MKFQISSDMGRTVLLHQSSKIFAGTVLQDQVPALPGSPHQRGTLQKKTVENPQKSDRQLTCTSLGERETIEQINQVCTSTN